MDFSPILVEFEQTVQWLVFATRVQCVCCCNASYHCHLYQTWRSKIIFDAWIEKQMQNAAYFETFLKALISDKQIPGFIYLTTMEMWLWEVIAEKSEKR